MGNVSITEIEDDIVIPSLMPRDPLGVPLNEEDKPETVVNDISDEIADIGNNNKSSLENKNDDQPPAQEEVEEGADGGSINQNTDIEEQPTGTESNNILRQTLKTMYGEDLTVITEIDGEEVEVSIDEIDVDSDTFAQIIQAQKEAEKIEALKDKISISGISEFTKSMVETERAGGSIAPLKELKEAYLDPLEGIDMDTTEGQKEVLELYYKHAKKLSDKETEIFIKNFEAEGVLEENALEAKEAIQKAVEAQAKRIEEQAIAAKVQREENLKAYTKDLREVLKTKHGFNDTSVKKLVDSATKVKDGGSKTPLVEKFQQLMADPETAAELIMFTDNIEEYKKRVSQAKVVEAQLNTAKKIGAVKIGGNVDVRKRQKSDEDAVVPVTIIGK